MAVRRLNHAVLYVHGLERTVDFYRQTLGFEVRLQIPGRAAFLRAPGSANDHDLGLFEIGSGHAADQPLERRRKRFVIWGRSLIKWVSVR